jgi:hypothetical protein
LSISIGKRLGEALILSVYLAVDVLDVWPKSHVGCLVIAFLGVLGIVLFDGMFEDAFPLKRVVAIGSITVIACVIVYFAAPHFSLETPEVEVIGTLHPGNDPTPPLPKPCAGAAPDSNTTIVFLGSNALIASGAGKHIIVRRRQTPMVSIERTADGLFVDAEIFNAAGKLVGHVAKNEFHVITGDNSYIERRGDLSTLGVYDGNKTELLYVRYLSPSAMRVRGVFYLSGRPTAVITDNAARDGGITITESCFVGGDVLTFN